MKSEDLQLRYNEWHRQRLGEAPEIDPRQLAFFDWLLDLAQPKPSADLLDVACGQEEFLSFAAQRGLQVSGVDLSDLAAQEARRRVPDADVRVGEAESLRSTTDPSTSSRAWAVWSTSPTRPRARERCNAC